MSAAGVWDGIDGPNSFVPSISGTTLTISAGSCQIKGQLWRADANVSYTMPATDPTYDRIDILTLQLSRTASTSPTVVSPYIQQGVAAATPVPPALSQTPTGLWQIPICQYTAHHGGTTYDTLLDIRQFSGRTVINMTSKYHPSPANTCLGIETDTGNVYVWYPGSAKWVFLGPGANPIDPWKQVNLINGWANAAAPAPQVSYHYGLRNGSLELNGELRQAAAPTNAIFGVLPINYRPTSNQMQACGATAGVSGATSPYVQLDTAGNLSVQGVTISANPIIVFSVLFALDF